MPSAKKAREHSLRHGRYVGQCYCAAAQIANDSRCVFQVVDAMIAWFMSDKSDKDSAASIGLENRVTAQQVSQRVLRVHVTRHSRVKLHPF